MKDKTSVFNSQPRKILLYHGSDTEVKNPEVRKARYTKDFSWGFYCTEILKQAERWALRYNTPVVNLYDYTESSNLRILKFEKMTDQWLDFIANCRKGQTHKYDIVEGPMADDQIWDYVNDFINGKISRKAFWALAEFKYPTHQISFHTKQAIRCLSFIRSEIVAK